MLVLIPSNGKIMGHLVFTR